MNTTTIRVQMKNNSDARRIGQDRKFFGIPAKHNGGKTVILSVSGDMLEKACGLLDENCSVASYEVQS